MLYAEGIQNEPYGDKGYLFLPFERGPHQFKPLMYDKFKCVRVGLFPVVRSRYPRNPRKIINRWVEFEADSRRKFGSKLFPIRKVGVLHPDRIIPWIEQDVAMEARPRFDDDMEPIFEFPEPSQSS